MRMVLKNSPNWSPRRDGVAVDAIILHATASASTKSDVAWCCDPKSKVSYHAIVDRDGTVYKLVDTDEKAWHAGVSTFQGRSNCNDYSIGLSFANQNNGVEPYTDEQYAMAAELMSEWVVRYPQITRERVTTHAVVATPKGRKTDPLGLDLDRLLDLVKWPL